jgi:hypothetical protein
LEVGEVAASVVEEHEELAGRGRLKHDVAPMITLADDPSSLPIAMPTKLPVNCMSYSPRSILLACTPCPLQL